MKSFQANLSPKSLENLTKQLDNYGKELMEAQEDIIRELAEYVYDRIIFYVPVETGQLMNSFVMETSYYFSYALARVYTDLYYAKYVEFGTGIQGSKNSHPESQQRGWAYGDKTGQIAHKFVYNAVLDLEQNYVEIAKNVLRRKGLI